MNLLRTASAGAARMAAASDAPRADTERRTVPCRHCGAPMEVQRGRADAAEAASPYCCEGCAAAAAIVAAAGLDAWYERRASAAPRPEPLDVPARAWETIPVRRLACGRSEADVHVDGLRCASCAWVVERVLCAMPGVQDARVAVSSGRATLVFDAERVGLPALAERVAAIGYRPRPAGAAGPADDDLPTRAAVAIFAAMNVMGVSAALYAGWFDGIGAREAALFRWVSLVLATPVVTWSARPILEGAVAGLRARVMHVDLPVALGVLAMYAHGVWATFHGAEAWLDSLTMLVALLLTGRALEARGRRAASEAAMALAGSAPVTARRVTATGSEEVAAADLVVGDLVDVGLGEEIPADGRVVACSAGARVRMALLTGESEPVALQEGDDVVAGALVDAGTLRVRVEATGADTLVQRMSRALADAVERPAPRVLADRIAPAFTVATLVLAGLGGAGWYVARGAEAGAGVAMAVLVVACPCALALSGPLSTAAGLAAAARHGLLVRGGDALRKLVDVDVVAFDKTGTVTAGVPDVVSADDATLRIAVGLERASAHPIARAIRREAVRRGVAFPQAQDVVERPGQGVDGTVDGVCYALRAGGSGRVRLIRAPDEEARTVGLLELRDRPRADVERVLRTVAGRDGAGRGLGGTRRVVVLSGDRSEVVARVAAGLPFDEAHGGLRPDDKVAWIRAQRAAGRRVLFVGDGVNDGPAMAEADVACAMGGGAASSIAIADLVVLGDGLAPLAAGLACAREAERAVRRATARSIAYNVAAVGLALAGWMNPLVAAVLMPLSSGVVVYTAYGVWKRAAA